MLTVNIYYLTIMNIYIHIDFLKRFPLFSFPWSWNALDPVLKVIQSKNEFKQRVKKSLIVKYENFKCNKLFCYVCLSH